MMKYPIALSALFAFFAAYVAADEVIRPASQRFADRHSKATPDFQKHVVPLLGRLGCNSAKCHGSFQGQGDFRLSLFGFDFKSDHAALRAGASSESGSRINSSDAASSLIVLKPTEQIDHEGGRRLELDSWEHHLLLRWIESGAQGVAVERESPASDVQAEPIVPDANATVFFQETVQPILEDHCYECHGFSARKGNLSVVAREGLLSGGDSGPAIDVDAPQDSLLLSAISYDHDELQMPPSGKLSNAKIAALRAWVEAGAPWPEGRGAPRETGQVLASLHAEPTEVLFSEQHQTQQIRIIAQWNDGTREDVTCLARFQTNNDATVLVDRNGVATSTGEGDTHIIAFYDNGVAAIPVMKPYGDSVRQATESSDPSIDGFVNRKLNHLGLSPSEKCTDTEFLRRVSIDMTGTLPTPEEVLTFLNDRSVNKRTEKINELLERPSYSAWWTNKLCDFTGCNPKSISSLLEIAREDGYAKASQWYEWIFERVERNESYDQLVADLMLSDLSQRGDNMPYFWLRQSLEQPKDTAMSVAHAFLGIQLQCAECHKHPFDQWTQGDFNDFAEFFGPITKTKRRAAHDQDLELRLLRSGLVELKAGDDPRLPVVQWMRDPQNPWFARAFVNRVWAGYFNRGIVDPPDQFTPANPPSHPELLDWLSKGFIDSGYDMKWLHRQIVGSDTYQRSWKPNETNRNDDRNFSRAIPRRLPAEVVYDAIKQVAAASDQQREVRRNLQRRASGHLSMRMAGTHAMKVFGKPDRSINCDCERVNEPTLLQAIFMQNDPLLRMRLADSGWVIEMEDAEAAGEDLKIDKLLDQVWLRTVGRLPSAVDRARAEKHLSQTTSIASGIRDLLWAMVNSKEFLLNH